MTTTTTREEQEEKRQRQAAAIIISLCKRHGCPETISKIHFDQAVYRGWQPHPPKGFLAWWASHPDSDNSARGAVKAYNVLSYRQEYLRSLPPGKRR